MSRVLVPVLVATALLLPAAASAQPFPDLVVNGFAVVAAADAAAGTFHYSGDCNGGGFVTLELGDFHVHDYAVQSVMVPDCASFMPLVPVEWHLLVDGYPFLSGAGEYRNGAWVLHGTHHDGALVVVAAAG